MPLGNPISLTRNVASREVSVSATAEQTLFTVTGGYRINQIDVFRNGVKLNATDDFTALDGSTVTLADPAAVNDEVVFRILDDFRVADAIVSAASSQVVSGNLRVVGDLFADSLDIGSLGSDQLNIAGVTTIGGVTRITDTTDSTSNTTGALVVSGGVGIAKTVNIGGSLDVDGNVTIGGTITYEDVTNVDSIGVITARTKIVLGDFIEHLDDTDTKFGFSAEDTFTIHTDGSEKLRLTNQGRLGIGTDSPDEMLEIFGVDPKIRLTDSTQDKNNRRSEIFNNEGDTTYNTVKAGAAGTHIFQGNGTELLRITSDGDLIATGGLDAIGIQSGGVNIAVGIITALNFLGAGNTFSYDEANKTVDINITGGATGAGSDQVFFENKRDVTADYTLTAGYSAHSVGPVNVAAGVTVTVPAGERWVIL